MVSNANSSRTDATPGKQLGLVTYCLPISPVKCRIMAHFPRNFAQQLHHLVPR
ncbi:hypothetical protein RintRC_1204 [Richelia intracellularis]|nr:hypothetical protein RintRC_1204 [Richelia intracellularis]